MHCARRLERLPVRLAVLQRAEQREAERVGPHVEAAERDADDGAEFRPERLDVAHLPEVLADRRGAPRLLVADELVMGRPAASAARMLGRQHPGRHRIVRALDARDVDEAGGAADQRAAGKGQLRHRLVAALGDRARAIGDALAALERVAHRTDAS